ncbi:helix-turn-helix domain-containing protein [Actinomadura sp. NPDC047616]|uniref:helix-turn-helix domain-containing protein n=1 Tax=Actinomadura sp. NPDC047616 TaxID=3155914 RepID=UPI00340050EC
MNTLAERLDYLFKTVHPAGRGPYSYEEAAQAITQQTGVSITRTALWKLRTGQTADPQFSTLKAIAEFFGVPVTYFSDDSKAQAVMEELELVKLIRDTGLGSGHLRTLAAMTPEGQQHIAEMILSTARMEQQRRAT